MSDPLRVDRREPSAGRRRVGAWPLELESARWAEALMHAMPRPFHELGVDASRRIPVGSAGLPARAVRQVLNVDVSTSRGTIPIRVYRPREATDQPVVVQLHGGGWTLGRLDGSEHLCRELAVAAGAIVVSVDYPLAPEHPFPAAIEACAEVIAWIASGPATLAALGADARRIAVFGDSAGGNLAAALTIVARDRGGPRLGAQVLAYPPVRRLTEVDTDMVWPTSPLLERGDVDWFWDVYGVPERGDSRAFPIEAPLLDLPPALVVLAEVDPLRDQGLEYAGALQEAGVPVTVVEYGGTFHGFLPRPTILPSAADAIQVCGAFLRSVL